MPGIPRFRFVAIAVLYGPIALLHIVTIISVIYGALTMGNAIYVFIINAIPHIFKTEGLMLMILLPFYLSHILLPLFFLQYLVPYYLISIVALFLIDQVFYKRKNSDIETSE